MAQSLSKNPGPGKGLPLPKDAEFKAARNTYILIIVSFLSVITMAVTLTVLQESQHKGFRAIETTAPMSFFDRTYMVDDVGDKPATAPAPTEADGQ
ncbi:MAG: hypothetical protein KC474_09675 [Cyanobacteria bacterium HKST-UBA04]|nr:hypothetical protein [Cyanobacteria bacterium HKST-UBA04]MCA9842010.1 hypothetical protein [Cyanobacteria bacterium HKST-UBA03]